MFPFDDSLTFDEIQDITRHESKRVIAVTGGISDKGLINEVCMSYSPLPIYGLDSCPIRAYAIEGLAEFSR